jgi:transposase
MNKNKQYKTFVGADLHKQFTYFVAQDKMGREISRMKIPNDGKVFKAFFETLEQPLIVAVESTSNWAWFAGEVKARGADVIVGHAAETRAKSGTRDKTDYKDARFLSYLLRGGLIEKQCWQAPENVIQIRERLRAMQFLTKQKTANKNRIHSILIRNNIKMPCKDIFCQKGRRILRSLNLPEQYKVGIERELVLIEIIEDMLEADMEFCRQLAREDELARLLTGIPGVGLQLACMIRYEIGDIERFDRPEALVSYAGLVPGRKQSADTDIRTGITKEGAFWLRWALVQAAQTANRTRGKLNVFYWRQMRKGKNHNKAIVATAREILVIVFHIMRNRQGYYEPLALSKRYAR